MKRRKLFRGMMLAVLLALLLALAGCSGSDGAPGATGPAGPAGPAGPSTIDPLAYTVFDRGQVSTQGGIQAKHGDSLAADYLAEEGPLATVAITGATADAAGLATVTFTVRNAAGAPVTGLGAANGASFQIASLAPKGGGFSYNKWVSYIWRCQPSNGKSGLSRTMARSSKAPPAHTPTPLPRIWPRLPSRRGSGDHV